MPVESQMIGSTRSGSNTVFNHPACDLRFNLGLDLTTHHGEAQAPLGEFVLKNQETSQQLRGVLFYSNELKHPVCGPSQLPNSLRVQHDHRQIMLQTLLDQTCLK